MRIKNNKKKMEFLRIGKQVRAFGDQMKFLCMRGILEMIEKVTGVPRN